MRLEHRKHVRKKAFIKVIIKKYNVTGYLRDLSTEGYRICLSAPIPIQREDALIATLLPGAENGIPPIPVFLEVLWTRWESIYFCFGGRVAAYPGDVNLPNLKKLYDKLQFEAPSKDMIHAPTGPSLSGR